MGSVTTPGGTTLNPLKIRRSITPNAVPTAPLLDEGELAANLKDLILYTKDNDGNIVKLGQNYDAILAAHFQARNPHGTTKADVGLSNVPNENLKPLYYYNSGSRTLNTPRIMTRMDYAAAANVTYTIDASKYAVGDQFEIARLADSAGEITVALNAGDWLIDGSRSATDLRIHEQTFMAILTKAQADLWTVKVQYV